MMPSGSAGDAEGVELLNINQKQFPFHQYQLQHSANAKRSTLIRSNRHETSKKEGPLVVPGLGANDK